MSRLVTSLINLLSLSTGRRRYALAQMYPLAKDSGNKALLALVEAAIAQEEKIAGQEDAWRRSKMLPKGRGDAVKIDARNDRLLNSIASVAKAQAADDDGSGICEAGKRVVAMAFPEGVSAVTVQAFEDQLTSNDTIIGLLEGKLKAEVALLNIERLVQNLRESNEAFRVELAKRADKEITFDEVEAARESGNLNLRQIVACVLGSDNDMSPLAEGKKQRLLAPILEQEERVRLARRGRRKPLDIDPKTGEEIVPVPQEQ